MQAVGQEERLLSPASVASRTSLSRTSLWRLSARGDFPRPVRLVGNRIAWPESLVSAWIASRPATK